MVAETNMVMGIIQRKDIVKPRIAERLQSSGTMGLRTVMIGDNPLTADPARVARERAAP